MREWERELNTQIHPVCLAVFVWCVDDEWYLAANCSQNGNLSCNNHLSSTVNVLIYDDFHRIVEQSELLFFFPVNVFRMDIDRLWMVSSCFVYAVLMVWTKRSVYLVECWFGPQNWLLQCYNSSLVMCIRSYVVTPFQPQTQIQLASCAVGHNPRCNGTTEHNYFQLPADLKSTTVNSTKTNLKCCV